MTSVFTAIEPQSFPWFDYARYTFSLGLQRDGKAWLSGHSASEYDPQERRIVVRGDMADQARTAYAKVAAILDGAGLTPGDAYRIVENVTLAGVDAYAEAAAVREEIFGARAPAVCPTVVDRLLRPAAWIEVEVMAGAGGASGPQGSFDADGIVYLPTLSAPQAGPAPGAQTDAIAQDLVARLDAAGLTLSDVVHVEVGVAAGHDVHEALSPLRAAFGASLPALVIRRPTRLLHAGEAVALTATATRGERVAVGETILGTPAAVRSGSSVWLSGASLLRPEPLPDGVVAQAEAIYGALLDVLVDLGGGPGNLLKTIEYVTPEGLDAYRGVAGVRDRVLTAPYPASTGAVVAAHARPGALIEVAATAVIP